MTRTSSAGPSRRRPDSASPEPSAGPSTQRGGRTQLEESTARRRKARLSTREDLFRNQDPAEKLRIGTGYRELQKVADRMKLDGTADARDLVKVLGKANKLFDNVKDTELAALDAKVFGTAIDAAANLIRKSKLSHAAYDVDEFLRSLKVALGLDVIEQQQLAEDEGDELEEDDVLRGDAALRRYANGDVVGDWAKLGWMAAQLNRRVPGVEFMYGPLAVEHQKRVVAPRQRRAEPAPVVAPKEIAPETQQKSKDITATNVRIIYKVLRQMDREGKGVNYFRLVVNPDDFGQTVENVFYTSFLIHDGKAGVAVQPDGEILIYHRDGHNVDVDGDIPKNQAVIELTEADWKEAIKLFNITSSKIPHRERPTQAPGADGWYAGTAT